MYLMELFEATQRAVLECLEAGCDPKLAQVHVEHMALLWPLLELHMGSTWRGDQKVVILKS